MKLFNKQITQRDKTSQPTKDLIKDQHSYLMEISKETMIFKLMTDTIHQRVL